MAIVDEKKGFVVTYFPIFMLNMGRYEKEKETRANSF